MWTYILIDDIPGWERFRDLMLQSGNVCDVPRLRNMAKFSRGRAYIYDDPNFTIAVGYRLHERRKWYYLGGLTLAGQAQPNVVAPLLSDQTRQYLQLVGANTLYVFASQQLPPLQSQVLDLITQMPGITVTKMPYPPHDSIQMVFS